MTINILPEAEADLVEAYEFYERSDSGVGAYFIESLSADIESLLVTGPVHALRFGKHCKVASKFPYSIYYTGEDDEIVVSAVLDDRRDPQWISDRLN